MSLVKSFVTDCFVVTVFNLMVYTLLVVLASNIIGHIICYKLLSCRSPQHHCLYTALFSKHIMSLVTSFLQTFLLSQPKTSFVSYYFVVTGYNVIGYIICYWLFCCHSPQHHLLHTALLSKHIMSLVTSLFTDWFVVTAHIIICFILLCCQSI